MSELGPMPGYMPFRPSLDRSFMAVSGRPGTINTVRSVYQMKGFATE